MAKKSEINWPEDGIILKFEHHADTEQLECFVADDIPATVLNIALMQCIRDGSEELARAVVGVTSDIIAFNDNPEAVIRDIREFAKKRREAYEETCAKCAKCEMCEMCVMCETCETCEAAKKVKL